MLKWIQRGIKVMSVLSVSIPAALADNTITVAECLDICGKLFSAFGVEIVVEPDKIADLKNQLVEVKEMIK